MIIIIPVGTSTVRLVMLVNYDRGRLRVILIGPSSEIRQISGDLRRKRRGSGTCPIFRGGQSDGSNSVDGCFWALFYWEIKNICAVSACTRLPDRQNNVRVPHCLL